MKPKPDIFDVLRDAVAARRLDLWYRSLPPGLYTDAELIELLEPVSKEQIEAAGAQIVRELLAKGVSRATIAANATRTLREIEKVKARRDRRCQ